MASWQEFRRILFLVLYSSLITLFITSLVISNWWLFGFSLALNYIFTAQLTLDVLKQSKDSYFFANFYLATFVFLPFLSTFCYALVLGTYIEQKLIDKYDQLMNKFKSFELHEETPLLIDANIEGSSIANKIFLYNHNLSRSPVHTNNPLDFVASPLEHIESLINLINKAKKFIHMDFYIFADGYVSDYLLSLIYKKIKEGVQVRMLADYYGNFSRLSRKTIKKMKKMGIAFKYFNPIIKTYGMWWHHRDHNKIIIVDNEYAFYGSCNIADEYFNITSYFFQTSESSVILSGPVVNSLNIVFLTHWNFNKPYRDEALENTLVPAKKEIKDGYSVIETYMQFVNSCPLHTEKAIKENLLQLIYEAAEEIIIVTPYFYPSKDIMCALKTASRAGVKIRILVPKQSDFFYINRRALLELSDSKIEIYEHFGFNHQKVTVIDRQLVHFGTYNWDNRALYLNFETALLVKDDNFTSKMLKNLLQKFNNSHRVSFEDLQVPDSFGNRIINNLIIWFKPFL